MALTKEQHTAIKAKCFAENGFYFKFDKKYKDAYRHLTKKIFSISVDVPNHVAIKFFRFILKSDRPFNEVLHETMQAAPARNPDLYAEIAVRQMIVSRNAMKDSAPPSTISQQHEDIINEFTHRSQVCRFSDRHFYASREWKELRLAVLSAQRACRLCGHSPLTGAVLHVDHIKPRSLWPELSLDISNLQVLCAKCNMAKSNIISGRF